jgi:hypothetical protein
LIYLDQDFYEIAWALRADLAAGGVLVDMVSLKYGDEMILSPARLEDGLDELERLAGSALASHPQFESFRAVIRSALDARSEIAISGDMYPERF